MPIVVINRDAGYDYAPLGRVLNTGENVVTADELAILQANEQIRREADYGVLGWYDEPSEPVVQTEPAGEVEAPPADEPKPKKGK
jgi:hypothetical protein